VGQQGKLFVFVVLDRYPDWTLKSKGSPYLYVITTWSQLDLAQQAIASLPPGAEYILVNIKDLRFKSIAEAWNSIVKASLINGDFQSVILCGDDVVCVGDTGKTLHESLLTLYPSHNVLMTTAYDMGRVGNRGTKPRFVSGDSAGMFCFCINHNLLEKIGYFDEQFERAWFEDVDMQWRIFHADYKIASVAPVWHIGGATTDRDPEVAKAKEYYFPLNRQRFINKWGIDPQGQRS
jgi:hypothetical protein